MALLKAPSTVALVLTTEFFAFGGIVAREGSIPHRSDFRPAEQR
ncbi:hypothetical protein [Actinoplanes regularis]|nr:hypothetical protein [Actinoplanes regularis]